MLYHRSLVILLAALASEVYGHGAMVAITGANGVTAIGMGIDTSTPRDGTRRRPFQQDTSIIRDREIESGRAGACGRTLEGGNNDVAAGVTAAAAAGMPAMAEDGTVSMTIHQINGDGAGPYTCEISTDATGANFTPMTVTTNVPGRNSRSRAKATDFPLVAQAPAGTACTGGPDGNACIVRCRNDARAGPFGGCAVVMNPENAAASTEAAAAETSAAEATATAGEGAAAETSAAEATATAGEGAAAAEGAATRAGAAASANEEEEFDKRQDAEEFDDEEEFDHEDFDEEPIKKFTKRSFLAPVFDMFAKRDHSRKRMVTSRIVSTEKRGKWI